MRTFALLLFSAMVIAFFGSNAIAQKIEVKDGVRIVHNDKPLWGKEPKIKLEFVHKIGGLDAVDENSIMFKIWNIAVDQTGNIYILDTGNARVQVFNSGGKFIKTIGSKGQGPGEFNIPVNINIDRKDRIIIGDLRANLFLILSPEGIELSRFKIDNEKTGIISPRCRLLNDTILVEGGFEQGTINMQSYEKVKNTGYLSLLHISDFSGACRASFGEIDIKDEKSEVLYSSNAAFDVSRDGYIWSVSRYDNKIEKWDANGKLQSVADRKIRYKDTGFNHDWWQDAYSNSVSTALAVDGKNRIWIATIQEQPKEWKEIWSEAERLKVKAEWAVFEIFNSEGVLLGKIPLPQDIFTIRIFGDKIYIVGVDRVSVSYYRIIDLEE
jgi:hypothetical protein